MTKEILPFGATNQFVDIFRTNATNILIAAESPRPYAPTMEQIVRRGTGNCGDHSIVTFDLLGREQLKVPVLRVEAHNVDHHFVILGDPRETSEVVVADSWVTFPTAHLLSEGIFEAGKILDQISPSTTELAFDIDRSWVAVPPSDFGGTEIAEAYLHDYINKKGGWAYSQLTSTKNIGTGYSVGRNTYQFDAYPKNKVTELLGHYDSNSKFKTTLNSDAMSSS